MDKKQLMWMFLLAIGIALLMNQFSNKDKAKQAPADAPAVSSLPKANLSPVYGGKAITAAEDIANQTQRPRIGALGDDGWKLQLELDPRGAGIYTARLADEFQTAAQSRKKDKTPQELLDWSYRVINAVQQTGGSVSAMPFSTQLLLIDDAVINTSKSGRTTVTGAGGQPTEGYIAWSPAAISTDGDTHTATFTLNIYDRADEQRQLLYSLIKTYTLKRGSYDFDVKLAVENHSGTAHNISVVQFGPTGLPREGLRMDMRDVVFAGYNGDTETIEVPKKGKTTLQDAVKNPGPKLLGSNAAGQDHSAVWAAAGNQFFGCIMYPVAPAVDTAAVTNETPVTDMLTTPDQRIFSFYSQVEGTGDNASQLVAYRSNPELVESGAALTYDFSVFCGPKGGNLFDQTPLYNKLGYRGAVTFRSCTLCLFEPLARGVMWIIENGGRAVGNYGVIIILLVCVIRLLLHPITRRSQVSMMKMKDMQPEMQRIQEKYKDDKEAQQKALMEFWKKTGATPLLGCLPMFVQMPIWIALWSGLSASVVLRHEGLLPFWITDLAGPDTVWAFENAINLPLLGNMMGPITGLHLLPLLLAVAMFLQQKFTPSTAAPGTEQEKQQKMMMWMMSVMMLLFFYNAPSGLTLYIMASTGSGVIESWVIRRHIAQKKEQQAAVETIVSAPGKGSRDTRPKKPKPPFKM